MEVGRKTKIIKENRKIWFPAQTISIFRVLLRFSEGQTCPRVHEKLFGVFLLIIASFPRLCLMCWSSWQRLCEVFHDLNFLHNFFGICDRQISFDNPLTEEFFRGQDQIIIASPFEVCLILFVRTRFQE